MILFITLKKDSSSIKVATSASHWELLEINHYCKGQILLLVYSSANMPILALLMAVEVLRLMLSLAFVLSSVKGRTTLHLLLWHLDTIATEEPKKERK